MAAKDMMGQRFGKLFVSTRSANLPDGTATWICICDCGNERKIPGNKLRTGLYKSCGCASPRFSSGHAANHGKSGSRAYKIWAGMLSRIRNPNYKKYHLYGGKGISFCKEWEKFENFYADMGEPPDGCSIDRIDGNKGYSKDNCRWADAKQQANNTSANHLVEYAGQIKTVSQWAESYGIKQNTLLYRLRRGWSAEKAINLPVKKRNY